MDTGWVKLHRKLLGNEIFRHDKTAKLLFIDLLLTVDRRYGSYTTGRYMLGKLTDLNPNTAYKALLRLQKAKMVTLASTNRYTLITICKWKEYQGDGTSSGNNNVPAKYQQSTTKQEATNVAKEIKEVKKATILVDPPEAVRRVFEEYLKCFNKNPNTNKLSPARRTRIQLRLKDAGLDMVLRAIQSTAQSPHHTGDNDRGWKADLDFIIRSYEQVERLAGLHERQEIDKKQSLKEALAHARW